MEPIMIFHISIDGKGISALQAKTGEAIIIPFSGHVESPLFTGVVRPGAADVQTVNAAGVRHMCASYMFEGKDSNGNPCHLFVRNDGYFQKDHKPGPFDATPTFLTDSPLLGSYLHTARFRSEGHMTDTGVDIRVFDVEKEQ